MKIPNEGGFTMVTLRDALYAPSIAFTLVSLSQADKAGYSTVIENGELHLINRSSNETVGKIPSQDRLWTIQTPKTLENADCFSGTQALTSLSLMDLHCCLGHISPSTVAQLIDKGILAGVAISDRNVNFCEVCALAKIKHQPFPKSCDTMAVEIGDVIHSDVWGPAPIQAIGGAVYAVTWIDEKSRYGVVEAMKVKNETFGEYKAYKAWLQLQPGRVIKHLQTDRGGEYMGTEFINHLCQQRTTRQLTVHDSPQSNGIAERCNGVLLNHVCTLLIDSGLPKFLWKAVLKFAMWIRNQTTTHELGGKTPYEAFYGIKPDVGDIHLWGSRVWVCNHTAGFSSVMHLSFAH